MSSTPVGEERSSSQGKKKWGASSLLFRNSGDGSSEVPSRKSEGDEVAADAATPATATDEDNDDEIWHDDVDDEDDDPLLSLFRVHNTNRVRFDLTPSSSTDVGAPSSSSAPAASFVDDNDNNIMNDCSEQSNNSKMSMNQSRNTQQLPTTQDKFKKLFIRTNHSSSHSNSGVGATPPPILLKKASSKLKHSSVNGNPHGVSNGSGGTAAGKNIFGLSRNDNYLGNADDDPDDAYIKKMLEPTPIRRISSFLIGGNSVSGFSGDSSSGKKTTTSSVASPREDGIKQSSKLSVNNYNVDNNSEINFATIKSLLSVNGNSPNRIDSSSSSSDNSHTSNRRRLRRRHHSLFRTTKYNDTNVAALLKKARYAHKHSFRYQLAMRYYLLALKEITSSSSSSGYSDTTADDPLTAHILKSLNDVHHAQVSLSNSSNIVQMGIQHEDANQLIKALRMYTIAYRMRRDALGVNHPSLAVILNMMGGVQIKRLDFDEAMRLYELSLNGRQDENGGRGRNILEFRNRNPLTTRCVC